MQHDDIIDKHQTKHLIFNSCVGCELSKDSCLMNFRHLLYLVCNIPSSTDICAKVAPPSTHGSTNRRILCDTDLCTRAMFVVCYGYVARIVLHIVYINELVMCKGML